MARPRRIGIPGAVYHVTWHRLERQAVVRDEADLSRWLSLLGDVTERRLRPTDRGVLRPRRRLRRIDRAA